MARIPDIIVCNGHGLGEYCDVKRIPNPGETCTAYNRRFEIDAGKGTNTACAIGRLGGNVVFIGKCALSMEGKHSRNFQEPRKRRPIVLKPIQPSKNYE